MVAAFVAEHLRRPQVQARTRPLRRPSAPRPMPWEWKSHGYPEQRPCLIGVGFPLSGPRADLHYFTCSPPV